MGLTLEHQQEFYHPEHIPMRHSLVYFSCVPPVDEVALAGGDVPLADGGVRRPRVHVDVVQSGARYVLRVAPRMETGADVAIKSSARLRESSSSGAVDPTKRVVFVHRRSVMRSSYPFGSGNIHRKSAFTQTIARYQYVV